MTSPLLEPPLDTSPEVRLLQFNMCGSSCNRGSTGKVVTALRDSILAFQPDICLLNEACLAQIDRLWEQLDLAGYSYSACFGATSGRSQCPGPEGERWYGNAVLSRGVGIGEPGAIALPNKPHLHEQRSVISMAAELRGVPAIVSATHLAQSKDGEFNPRQMTAVAKIQNERAAAGNVVIFGGDFNATPDKLVEITGPQGRFREVDHADLSPTLNRRKIDYIFVDRTHFSGLSGSVTKSAVSDHRLLTARATLAVPGAR